MPYNTEGYPPNSQVKVWDMAAERYLNLWFNGDKVDFHDTIMRSNSDLEGTFLILWTTDSSDWKVWDEAAIDKINEQLHYDFNFEGYAVEVECVSGHGQPCCESAGWQLTISGPLDED